MRCLAFVALLFLAVPATAQVAPEPPPAAIAAPVTLDLLVSAQAGLHAVDMVTTAYALHLGADAREANPLLAFAGSRPVALAAVSGAVDILQAYTLAKVQRRHPRLATVWALALVATEGWATANNLAAIRDLQRRAGR